MDSKHLPLASFKRLTCFFFFSLRLALLLHGLSLVAWAWAFIEAVPLLLWSTGFRTSGLQELQHTGQQRAFDS